VTPGIRISAALIVRDEEKFLGGCLASIVDHVDEIVIVDTGSIDGTVAIAQSYGVRLLHRQWRNDFAWARNEGLAATSGDWILYIDADERLVVPPGANLRDNLDGDGVFAARVHFRPTVNATPFREYRLFRNDPRLRFRGSMHETILPDLDHLKATISARVADSPVELVHLGYEDGSEWKHERNLPLLRAAIAENPDRLYYWYHLALTLAGLGQVDEALAVGAEGLRRARDNQLVASDSAIAALLAFTQARLLHERGEDPLPTIAQGYRHYPSNPTLQLLEARVLVDRGRLDEAVPILEALIAVDSATYSDPRLAHDRRIFDVYAPDLLGVALLRLGRRQEAAASFSRAAAAAPDNMSYRIKAQALGAHP
jgi:tetratricopeptide (TPR) repeat protein